mgnify:CR=1 FL=1|jgi:intergrase/recombinase
MALSRSLHSYFQIIIKDTIERINEIEDICGIERHFDASSFTCQVKSLNDVFSAATKLRTDWNIGNAFENLIYRALSSGLITESKAAVLLNKTTEEVLHNFVLA